MINNVIITGGLGNQMFQYAFALALRHRGFDVKLDISLYNMVKMHNGCELFTIFDIDEKPINKKGLHVFFLRFLLKFQPASLIRMDTVCYDLENLLTEKHFFSGVWLSENYFKNIEDQIRKEFQFKNIDPRNIAIAQEMQNCNSVSVHIRRGDYVAWGISLLGYEYYAQAIKTFKDKVDNLKFYFFSDDVDVAKEIAGHFDIEYNIINHNKGENSYQDMFLMSQCKHNIIANSSFSWWGAWLNKNIKKIVVAPKEWVGGDDLHHPQLNTWTLI